MATYDELLTIATGATGDSLKRKIRVAVIVAADAVRAEADATVNHAARMTWARATFAAPDQAAERMLWAVLAANKGATAAQITGASDALVQTHVDAAVNVLAGV